MKSKKKQQQNLSLFLHGVAQIDLVDTHGILVVMARIRHSRTLQSLIVSDILDCR